MGFFDKLKQGLSKTRAAFADNLSDIFAGGHINEDMYDQLEESLILADVGARTSCELVDKLRIRVKKEHLTDSTLLKEVLQEEIAAILCSDNSNLHFAQGQLTVLMMVGVNGVGKTTTIGKLAAYLVEQKKKVLLAAADTFRAAATEQLVEWGNRVGVDVIRHTQGSDPGAVVFDACQAAVARKTDVLIVDTAGRLQNKSNLMEELKKIGKIIAREAPNAHVEVLLVLDAGMGQNAISQAKLFGEAVELSGLVLTKLDGTAKGGVVIGIKNETNLPVKMIGVGEGIDDLREFVATDFVKALFG